MLRFRDQGSRPGYVHCHWKGNLHLRTRLPAWRGRTAPKGNCAPPVRKMKLVRQALGLVFGRGGNE
jgi:hypothetical protein